jgi:hypothetical protein
VEIWWREVESLGRQLRQELGRIRPLVQVDRQSNPPRAQLGHDRLAQDRNLEAAGQLLTEVRAGYPTNVFPFPPG